MSKAIIHVHQQKIKKNEPAIICRTYKGSTHHRVLTIDGPVKIIHSGIPDKCGARCTIITDTKYITYKD